MHNKENAGAYSSAPAAQKPFARDLFWESLKAMDSPSVAEIGTLQSVKGIPTIHKSFFPNAKSYIGVDIEAGDDVDLVADVHSLSQAIACDSLDAVVAIAIFEHLKHPWVAMAEIGKVLKHGGIVYVETHFAFYEHAYPSDYYRYTQDGLRALADYAGLETVAVSYQNPCFIVLTIGSSAPVAQRAHSNVQLYARKK